ncbi:MAG: uracil-DNA glycosylase family protein [Muribaculaceae bacterium]|nr:uracil-DNA glycosylase family protein [Muribaculaceae bacterium]
MNTDNANDRELNIESHPWPPFIPDGAKIMIMGTFPPQDKRWNMNFYYPNRTNDFWKIMGLLFLGNKDALLLPDSKDYDLNAIIQLMTEKKIALNDTGRKVRRLKNNASDKFLEIVEPVPLFELLKELPECKALATTGEKAASVIAELTATSLPKMGEQITWLNPENQKVITIYRMPSTSRAYPMKLEQKAEYYAKMFKDLDIL